MSPVIQTLFALPNFLFLVSPCKGPRGLCVLVRLTGVIQEGWKKCTILTAKVPWAGPGLVHLR